MKDVQEVKLRTYGRLSENRALQLKLNTQTKRILEGELYRNSMIHLSAMYAGIFHKTKFDKDKYHRRNFNPLPKYVLIEMDNKFKLVEALQQICLRVEKRSKMTKNISDKAIAKFEERIHMVAEFIKEHRNSDQYRHDAEKEIAFLQIMAEVIAQTSTSPFNEAAKKLLDDAFELAQKHGSATENIQTEFKNLVNEAFKQATGLKISIEEKNMVLKAMGFQRGHWYKCENGHIYCIANCGKTLFSRI